MKKIIILTVVSFALLVLSACHRDICPGFVDSPSETEYMANDQQ